MQPGPGSQSSSESESEASGICVVASLVATPGVLAASDMAAVDGQPLKYVSGCDLLGNCLHLGESLLRYSKAAAIASGM